MVQIIYTNDIYTHIKQSLPIQISNKLKAFFFTLHFMLKKLVGKMLHLTLFTEIFFNKTKQCIPHYLPFSHTIMLQFIFI